MSASIPASRRPADDGPAGSGRPLAVVCGTGAIGGAVARELSATHRLLLLGRESPTMKHLAAELPDATSYWVDLTVSDAVQRLTTIDRVAVLGLCAGLWLGGSIAETTVDDWSLLMQVNVLGQLAVVRALLPALRAGQGRVIVLNSTAVMGPPGGRAAYTASKAALHVFSQALHEEERASGVQVTEIYPGRVSGPMQRRVRTSEGSPYDPTQQLDPSDVARAVRVVVDLPRGVHLTEFVIRPSFLPQPAP